jgi:hypothetical protein
MERASKRGSERLLKKILLNAERSLRLKLRQWGDPFARFPSLNTVLFLRITMKVGLRFEYHVHNDEPVVIWVSVQPLEVSPFAE